MFLMVFFFLDKKRLSEGGGLVLFESFVFIPAFSHLLHYFFKMSSNELISRCPSSVVDIALT